jgi:hypothetical protein
VVGLFFFGSIGLLVGPIIGLLTDQAINHQHGLRRTQFIQGMADYFETSMNDLESLTNDQLWDLAELYLSVWETEFERGVEDDIEKTTRAEALKAQNSW